MESIGYLDFSSGVPISGLNFMGDLRLHQRQPLHPYGIHSVYNISVLPTLSEEANDWKVKNILYEYWRRNCKW